MKISIKTALWQYATADTIKFMFYRYAQRLLIIFGINLLIMISILHWIGIITNIIGTLFSTVVITSYKKYAKQQEGAKNETGTKQ